MFSIRPSTVEVNHDGCFCCPEMLTILIFLESYRFPRQISALRFPTSKLRQITILKWYQVKTGVTPTSTPVIPDHR